MPSKTPRSPQEKKSLSYAYDRRNSFRENDKASRKAIPARKAAENRKARRKANQSLDGIEQMDEQQADTVESSMRHDVERVGGWKKQPDQPLADHIQQQAKLRKVRDGQEKH